jgi:Fur family peroxide stress response transcriptional regulator
MKGSRKHSRQRDAIYAVIRATDTHPSAEWIHAKVRDKLPEISIGTVYRNISIFKSDGTIVSVGVINGEERYDARTEEHAHFICERCGAVADIDTPAAGAGDREYVMKRYGALVHRRHTRYYGLCARCLGAEEK